MPLSLLSEREAATAVPFTMTELTPEDQTSPACDEIQAILAAEDEPWDAIALDPEAHHGPAVAAIADSEPADVVPQPRTASELVAEVAALSERIDRLQTLIEREVRSETTREKVVDRLHAELQEYKQDLLLSTLRPVFIDLIQLHDDIGKVALVPDGSDEQFDVKRLIELMKGFQQGIEDILYRQGVEPFQVDDEAFDPRRQRAVMTVLDDDPARNKTLAERLRKGFRSGERIIRPEIVAVFSQKRG